MRDRVPQLLQERRLHRHALRVHRGAEDRSTPARRPAKRSRCIRSGTRRMTTKFNGVCYIVQRAAEALYSPEGKAQVAGAHQALPGQRGSSAQRREEGRTESLRRRERALHLGAHAARRHELAGVRQNFERGECRHHARQRLRFEGRRLFPHQRLQQPRQRRGSRAPVAGIEVVSQKFEIENRSWTLLRVLFYFVLLGVVVIALCIRHALVEKVQAGIMDCPCVN